MLDLPGFYRLAQFNSFRRLSDVYCPCFLLNLDLHGLLGLPDKQAPHGYVVDALLSSVRFVLGLDQTTNNIVAESETHINHNNYSISKGGNEHNQEC